MKKLIFILPFLLTACIDYSDGDRVGVVQKLSRKGFFCKTWEGEMLMGGMKKQTNTEGEGKNQHSYTTMVPNIFEFTVEDEKLLPKIQAAVESGEPVKLTYRQEAFSFCRSHSGNYFITDVK